MHNSTKISDYFLYYINLLNIAAKLMETIIITV